MKKVKKGFLATLILAIASFFCLFTVNQAVAVYASVAQVAFISDGSTYTTENVDSNNLVAEPNVPTKSGYDFAGWWEDTNYTRRWDFSSDTVSENMNLYAKWVVTPSIANSFEFELESSTYVNEETSLANGNSRSIRVGVDTFTIQYKIKKNDGVSALLLIPDYNKTVFSLQAVSVNGNNYNVTGATPQVATSEVLVDIGAPTVTDASAWANSNASILLGNVSASSPNYTQTSSNEYFLSLTYKINDGIERVNYNGDYTFGFKETAGVENNYSVAYRWNSNETVLERILLTLPTTTVILQQEGSASVLADQSFVYCNEPAVATNSTTNTAGKYIDYTFTATDATVASNVTATWYSYESQENVASAVNAGNYKLTVSISETPYFAACSANADFTILKRAVNFTMSATTTNVYFNATEQNLKDNGNLVLTITNTNSGVSYNYADYSGNTFQGYNNDSIFTDPYKIFVNGVNVDGENQERGEGLKSTVVNSWNIEVRYYITNPNYCGPNGQDHNYISCDTTWAILQANNQWTTQAKVFKSVDNVQKTATHMITFTENYDAIAEARYNQVYVNGSLSSTQPVTYTWYVNNNETYTQVENNTQPTEVGSYKVVASIQGTENYTGMTSEYTFTIAEQTAANLVDANKFTVAQKTFNGFAQDWFPVSNATTDFSALTVNDEGNYLTKYTLHSVTTTSLVYAGSTVFTLTLKATPGNAFVRESDNTTWTYTTIELTAIMNPLAVTITPDNKTITYGDAEATLTAKYTANGGEQTVYEAVNWPYNNVTLGDSLTFTFSIAGNTNENKSFGFLKAGTYNIVATPNYSSNVEESLINSYNLTLETGIYTVQKSSVQFITSASISGNSIYYLQSNPTITTTQSFGTVVIQQYYQQPGSSLTPDNETVWSNSNWVSTNGTFSNTTTYTNSTTENAGLYYFRAYVAETENYNASSLLIGQAYENGQVTGDPVSFTINKAVLPDVVFSYSTYSTQPNGTQNGVASWANLTGAVTTLDLLDADKYISLPQTVTVKYFLGENEVTNNQIVADAASAYTIRAVAYTNNAVDTNYTESETTTVNAYSVSYQDEISRRNTIVAENEVCNLTNYPTNYLFHGQVAHVPTASPTVVGHTFANWQTLNGQEYTNYNFSSPVNANVVLYTSWTATTYTITWMNYYANSACPVATSTVEYGIRPNYYQTTQTSPSIATTSQYSYEFKNLWSVNPETQSTVEVENTVYSLVEGSTNNLPQASADVTYYAVYILTPENHIITLQYKIDSNTYTERATFNVSYSANILNEIATNGQSESSLPTYTWFRNDAWYYDSARTRKVAVSDTMPEDSLTLYGALVFNVGNGDVNGDGKVGADDISIFRSYVVGNTSSFTTVLTGHEYEVSSANNFNSSASYYLTRVADVNGDNGMDLRDITTIRMAIVGGYGFSVVSGVIPANGETSAVGVTGKRIVVGNETVVSKSTVEQSNIAGNTITATTQEQNVNTAIVTISGDIAENISSNQDITVVTDVATVVFDSTTDVFTGEQKEVVLEVSNVETSTLSDSQLQAIGENHEDAVVLSINLSVGGTSVHTLGSNNASATVYLPYEDAVSGQTYTVYYLKNDGTVEEIVGHGIVSPYKAIEFSTTHFSTFFVRKVVATVTVGGQTYNVSSLSEAEQTAESKITSASSSVNITLTRDVNMSSVALFDYSAITTLNLNGHTVNCGGINVKNGNLTLTGNGTVNGYVYVHNGSNLVIENGNYNSFLLADDRANLTINNGTFVSNDCGIYVDNNSRLVVVNGNFTSQEACLLAEYNSSITVTGGTFTSRDNFVVGTNGSTGHGGNTITLNGGVYNGNIQTANYIACGVYLANNDTLTINGATFNINGGVGILARAGKINLDYDNTTFNFTNTKGLDGGWVGDRKTSVPVGVKLYYDVAANYPGYTVDGANNTVTYSVSSETLSSLNLDKANGLLYNDANYVTVSVKQ